MATLQSIERGITRFVDREILPNINSGWSFSFGGGVFPFDMEIPVGIKRAVFGTAGAILAKKATAFLVSSGMVGGDDTVDLDLIRREFIPRLPEEGVRITLPGNTAMTLTAKDVETLYRYINEA